MNKRLGADWGPPEESGKRGLTRRNFVARGSAALLATYGGPLRGLPLAGLGVADAAEEMKAVLGTTKATAGVMQLGS